MLLKVRNSLPRNCCEMLCHSSAGWPIWPTARNFLSHRRIIHFSSGNTPSFSPTSESLRRPRQSVLSKKLPLFRSFRLSWRRQTFLDSAFRPSASTEGTSTLAEEKRRIQHTYFRRDMIPFSWAKKERAKEYSVRVFSLLNDRSLWSPARKWVS